MKWNDPSIGLSVTEQLYTARGSQGIGTSQTTADMVGVNPKNYKDLLLLIDYGFGEDPDATDYYKSRVLWTGIGQPDWAVGIFTLYMNIPYWVYITEITMDEFICLHLFIKVNDPDDHGLIDQIT